jgi:hypothetical protein
MAGDWRLPNVREMHSLIDFGFLSPALSNIAGTAQWTEGDAFSSVQVARLLVFYHSQERSVRRIFHLPGLRQHLRGRQDQPHLCVAGPRETIAAWKL